MNKILKTLLAAVVMLGCISFGANATSRMFPDGSWRIYNEGASANGIIVSTNNQVGLAIDPSPTQNITFRVSGNIEADGVILGGASVTGSVFHGDVIGNVTGNLAGNVSGNTLIVNTANINYLGQSVDAQDYNITDINDLDADQVTASVSFYTPLATITQGIFTTASITYLGSDLDAQAYNITDIGTASGVTVDFTYGIIDYLGQNLDAGDYDITNIDDLDADQATASVCLYTPIGRITEAAITTATITYLGSNLDAQSYNINDVGTLTAVTGDIDYLGGNIDCQAYNLSDVGTITAVTANISNGDIAAEHVTGDVISDGTATLTGGALSGITTITATTLNVTNLGANLDAQDYDITNIDDLDGDQVTASVRFYTPLAYIGTANIDYFGQDIDAQTNDITDLGTVQGVTADFDYLGANLDCQDYDVTDIDDLDADKVTASEQFYTPQAYIDTANITAFGTDMLGQGYDITGLDDLTGDDVTFDAGVFNTLSGALTGSLVGDVTGNLVGNSTGTHTGGVIGDVTGNVVGDLTGTANNAITANYALDSDLLDAQTGSYYQDADNINAGTLADEYLESDVVSADYTGTHVTLNTGLAVSTDFRVGDYAFPIADGTNTYVLKTNGAGVLAWAPDSTSGTAITHSIVIDPVYLHATRTPGTGSLSTSLMEYLSFDSGSSQNCKFQTEVPDWQDAAVSVNLIITYTTSDNANEATISYTVGYTMVGNDEDLNGAFTTITDELEPSGNSGIKFVERVPLAPAEDGDSIQVYFERDDSDGYDDALWILNFEIEYMRNE